MPHSHMRNYRFQYAENYAEIGKFNCHTKTPHVDTPGVPYAPR